MEMDDDGRGSLARRKWTVLQLVSYWVIIWDAHHIVLPAWINEYAKRGQLVTINED